MSETSSRRPSLWFALAAAVVAAAVWATVAMAAGGSGSSGTGSPVASYDGAHSMYAADGSNTQGDCPNMGGSGGGGSTTPSTPTTPNSSSPSTQDGSSNPAL
jgi:hypothetical protein